MIGNGVDICHLLWLRIILGYVGVLHDSGNLMTIPRVVWVSFLLINLLYSEEYFTCNSNRDLGLV